MTKIPLTTETEPTGETIEEYGERIVAMVRKDMLDRLPDDVIGTIKESHLIFGKACAMKAVANAMEEMSVSMSEARAAAPSLARKAASADRLVEALKRIDGEAPAKESSAKPTVGFPPSRDPEYDDGNSIVEEAFDEGVAHGLWIAAQIARDALGAERDG